MAVCKGSRSVAKDRDDQPSSEEKLDNLFERSRLAMATSEEGLCILEAFRRIRSLEVRQALITWL